MDDYTDLINIVHFYRLDDSRGGRGRWLEEPDSGTWGGYSALLYNNTVAFISALVLVIYRLLGIRFHKNVEETYELLYASELSRSSCVQKPLSRLDFLTRH
ncbi:hypothetical protein M438DRAFT_188160 [Aureobasidium pullulans EXF-150]|uniref:Uncharacterized protein n=1 Tax=Aureobasidium pullulans EXF-150 TaxID=1043002 RepID=A0A074XQR7_AURPU|nr:uncharacterized protein M438DRAFT_188160 [Aureobasidium pullulans EXF-150]KEQ85994.1 hypothetical protein M438DRAFT_188160 [Aureobasidium pullulans EXF-150]